MAADILALLIKTNLAAAAAILLALALRRSVRRTFGARLAYALWLVVPLTVGACLAPARTMVVPHAPPPEAAVGADAASMVASVTNPAMLIDGVAVIILWLTGAAISLSLLVWSQSRFMKNLGGVVREGQFLRAKAPAAGPAVVGAVFPRIVLPADFETRYNPAEQEVVLAHEAAHLASGDAAVNAMVALARCLFWFNPLIHIAARVLRVDQELACDAVVLQAHPQMRRPYAEAMLKTQLAAAPLPLGCYWPAGASHPLKERIAMLKFDTPSRSRRLCGAAGVVALCLGAGFAAWAAQPADVTFVGASTGAQSSPLKATLAAPPLQISATAELRTEVPMPPPGRPVATAALTNSMVRSPAGNTYQRIDAEPGPTAERRAQERARLEADYNPISVTTRNGRGRFSTWVPKKFTAEAKAHALARIDQEMEGLSPEEREGFAKAREIIALMIPTE